MSDWVIKAENLGKCYRIKHQRRERYVALRDVLTDKFRNLFQTRNVESKPLNADEEFWALKDVSFDIKAGEVVGIIGRNGAGKSTLLKILSRITEPTKGRVMLRGRVASLLEVGTGFHPELTGRENIFLNGTILGMTRAEVRRNFDAIVEFAEVEKFLDTPVKRYSSGMYVRLAFAVAAHLESEILIIDEVLAVGDAQFQQKCLGKIGDAASAGRAVLYVSHNMSAVRGLCSRGIWLSSGGLLREGSATEVINAYMSTNVTSMTTSLDVGAIVRDAHYGCSLRLLHVQFNEGRPLLNGEPVHIVIDYEASSTLEDVSFGIGFSSISGTRIMSIDSDIPGRRLEVHAGSGRVECRIDRLWLEPDMYVLDFGSRSGDNFGLDYLPSCAHVSVFPGVETPSVIAGRSDGRGGVRLPAHWSNHGTRVEMK